MVASSVGRLLVTSTILLSGITPAAMVSTSVAPTLALALILASVLPVSPTLYSLAGACGCQCVTKPPKDGVKGGNCKTAYKGRLWCYIEEIDGNVYCKDATKSRNYSGTYWSYDACFTPARTDQLCQLVVAEGKTKCNTLSGTGRREVKQCPITAVTPLERRVEPTATMFCSQFPLSMSKREEKGRRRPLITDQTIATDSRGARWYCNKSCFYGGDIGGLAAPPTCYFPPLVPTSFTSPYDAGATVDVLRIKTERSGRDCTWQHRGEVWTCRLPSV